MEENRKLSRHKLTCESHVLHQYVVIILSLLHKRAHNPGIYSPTSLLTSPTHFTNPPTKPRTLIPLCLHLHSPPIASTTASPRTVLVHLLFAMPLAVHWTSQWLQLGKAHLRQKSTWVYGYTVEFQPLSMVYQLEQPPLSQTVFLSADWSSAV
jgi:hypothetical protein